MKSIYVKLMAAALVAPTITGCMEDPVMTSGATQEQLAESSKAAEALVWALPAYLNQFDLMASDQGYDWGYGGLMRVRDVMGEDLTIVSSGYDWFTSWEFNQRQGSNWMTTQWIWNFYSQLVLTTNNVIGTLPADSESAQIRSYRGMALATRAAYYLDMAQMFEFMPNDGVSPINNSGNDVTGLTVPIVTEKTTEEEARNNPRVSHADMFAFIMNDLAEAETLLTGAARLGKQLPDLSVVYGLMARAYMWNLDYPKAAESARKAINAGSYRPLNREEWLSTSSGFNTLDTPAWMWGGQCVKEDECVQSVILNWTSWASNEAVYGYAAAGPFSMIGAAIYDRINDRDFRKLSYKAPQGSALAGQEPVIDPEWAAGLPDYASFKFRPGEGNANDYNIGSSTALPLMRVEEMYFIEAEATAHTNPAAGKQLLEDFMKTYRYSSYTCRATAQDAIIDEIFFQKRVELWGEGLSFFDYKRLNKGVTRAYDGSNFQASALFNVTGRPAWMNFCIVQTEENNNKALVGWNNPDPSNCYPLAQ